MSTKKIIWCSVLFLLTRLFVFWIYAPVSSDTKYLVYYPFHLRDAAQKNISFYESFGRSEEIHDSFSRNEEMQKPAYPPFAIWMVSWPIFFFPHDDIYGRATFGSFFLWQQVFRAMMLVADAAVFALLLWFFSRRRLANPQAIYLALLSYVFLGLIHAEILYDRLDTLAAALIVGAALLLIDGRTYASFLLLAAAVHYRITPVVLVPLFVLGSSAVELRRGQWQAYLYDAVKNSLRFAAVFTACGLPFYLWAGSYGFDFLTFHKVRPIQVESLYSSVWILREKLRTGFAEVAHSYGSYNIVAGAAATGFFSALSHVLVLLGIVSATVFFAMARPAREATTGISAARQPALFCCALLGCFLASVTFAKVLSPQYLLVVNALAVLTLCFSEDHVLAALLLVIALLTTAIFPWSYQTDILQTDGAGSLPLGPTWFGLTLLVLRNLCLVLLTVHVFRKLWTGQKLPLH